MPSTRSPQRTLEIRRTFPAAREAVFQAWTRPEMLRRWWGVAEGYTTPLVEVDLRVGGRYRLGMLPPDSDDLIILTGEYLAIEPPDRLVFTWGMEAQDSVSHITLEFRGRGAQTELVLTHRYEGPAEYAENFRQGWEGMFDRLGKTIQGEKNV